MLSAVPATHLQAGGRPKPSYLPQRLDTERAGQPGAAPKVRAGTLPLLLWAPWGGAAGPGWGRPVPSSGGCGPLGSPGPAALADSCARSAVPAVPSGRPTVPGRKVPPSAPGPGPLTAAREPSSEPPEPACAPPLPSSDLSAPPGRSGRAPRLCAAAVSAPAPRRPPAGRRQRYRRDRSRRPPPSLPREKRLQTQIGQRRPGASML